MGAFRLIAIPRVLSGVASRLHAVVWSGIAFLIGAGTGTFEFETASGVYTEQDCNPTRTCSSTPISAISTAAAPRLGAFEPSLFARPTVMGRPTEDRAFQP